MNQYGRIITYEPQPHVNHIAMVAMVPLLNSVSGYYTTFYNQIAMVLTPLRDPGKIIVEPHFILQGCIVPKDFRKKRRYKIVIVKSHGLFLFSGFYLLT